MVIFIFPVCDWKYPFFKNLFRNSKFDDTEAAAY